MLILIVCFSIHFNWKPFCLFVCFSFHVLDRVLIFKKKSNKKQILKKYSEKSAQNRHLLSNSLCQDYSWQCKTISTEPCLMHQAVEDFTCISQIQIGCRWTEEVPLPRGGSVWQQLKSCAQCDSTKEEFWTICSQNLQLSFLQEQSISQKGRDGPLCMHTRSLSICALFQNVVTEMKAHQQKWPRGWYFTFAQRERRSVKQCSLSLKTQQGRIGRISTSGLGSVSFTMSSIPDTAVSCPSWWSPTHLESLQFQWPSAELLGGSLELT